MGLEANIGMHINMSVLTMNVHPSTVTPAGLHA
jgi:hypothetical protein